MRPRAVYVEAAVVKSHLADLATVLMCLELDRCTDNHGPIIHLLIPQSMRMWLNMLEAMLTPKKGNDMSQVNLDCIVIRLRKVTASMTNALAFYQNLKF